MCALPKGFIKKVKFIKQNQGPEKRQDYLDEIDYKGTYLPKGIGYEDIDRSFINFINEDLKIVINGENIPVIFLTIQRWGEFNKTWELSDEHKNIKMPFITIVRNPDIQAGTNQAGLWNIPGQKAYTYIKVPTNKGGRTGLDTYKIPQPTSIDMTYNVRLYCNRMKDLNVFHKVVQKTFNSRQFYINVNSHPIPIHLENVSDESQINDFDKRKFYAQLFEMKALGYILDEEDFEVIPTIDRASVKFIEIGGVKPINNLILLSINNFNNDVVYDFNFKPNSLLEFNFNIDKNITFDEITDIINITNIIISLNTIEVHNGLIITTPIKTNVGDVITIKIITSEMNNNSLFNLNGKIILE
tara:strand:+ start:1532 stop:2602 length:1071 start_codon:yes stop_codon:yes gene_type:complete